MQPDDERQRAWREAVRAFRLTATTFEDPTPGLFAQFAAPEEGLRDLTRELPLVSFSPFGVLPGDTAYGRGAEPHRPATGSGWTTERVTERGTVGSGAGSSRKSWPPNGSGDLPVTSSRAGKPEDQPPVFSFRRGGASSGAGQQPSQRDRDTWEPLETPPDPNATVYRAVATDDRVAALGRGANNPTAEGYGSVHPMALLDGLAENAVEAAERWTPNIPVRRPGRPAPLDAPPDRRVDRSRKSGRKTGRDHGTDERASGESGSPWFETSAQSPAGSLPAEAEHRGSGFYTKIPGDPPEPALRTVHDEGAFSLIGSLTESLLAPEARSAGGSPKPSRVRDGRAEGSDVTSTWEQAREEATLGLPSSAFLDGAEAKPVGSSPSGSERLDQGRIAETGFERYAEAEDFASLVNDVLVRQARRHGVDLS